MCGFLNNGRTWTGWIMPVTEILATWLHLFSRSPPSKKRTPVTASLAATWLKQCFLSNSLCVVSLDPNRKIQGDGHKFSETPVGNEMARVACALLGETADTCTHRFLYLGSWDVGNKEGRKNNRKTWAKFSQNSMKSLFCPHTGFKNPPFMMWNLRYRNFFFLLQKLSQTESSTFSLLWT